MKFQKIHDTPLRKHSHAPWKGAECLRMEKRFILQDVTFFEAFTAKVAGKAATGLEAGTSRRKTCYGGICGGLCRSRSGARVSSGPRRRARGPDRYERSAFCNIYSIIRAAFRAHFVQHLQQNYCSIYSIPKSQRHTGNDTKRGPNSCSICSTNFAAFTAEFLQHLQQRQQENLVREIRFFATFTA